MSTLDYTFTWPCPATTGTYTSHVATEAAVRSYVYVVVGRSVVAGHPGTGRATVGPLIGRPKSRPDPESHEQTALATYSFTAGISHFYSVKLVSKQPPLLGAPLFSFSDGIRSLSTSQSNQ